MRRIVCLGDSLTSGHGINSAAAYPAQPCDHCKGPINVRERGDITYFDLLQNPYDPDDKAVIKTIKCSKCSIMSSNFYTNNPTIKAAVSGNIHQA